MSSDATRYVQGCFAFLATVCSGTAIAQYCSHASGNPAWTDDKGYSWFITQNGTGIGSPISGQVWVDCPNLWVWPVTGQYLGNGQIQVTAYNPGDWEYCWAGQFTYTGTIRRPGCNTGNGSWANDIGYSGFWGWLKGCEIPPYETTHSTMGSWNGPNYTFHAHVSNTSGGNLVGRKIRETDYATGTDYCWYLGSPIPKFEGITQPEPFDIYQSNNEYIDTIGWGSTAVAHYRNYNRAPCSTHIYQQMQIACGPSGSEYYTYYQNNILVAEIGVTTVKSVRDGVEQITTY